MFALRLGGSGMKMYKIKFVGLGKGHAITIVKIGDKLIKDLGVKSHGYKHQIWHIETDRTKDDLLGNLKQFNSDMGKVIIEEEE